MEILDKNTVHGLVNGGDKDIEVLHGGLPEGTYKVLMRTDANKLPDTQVVLGAYISGRDMPVTCIGQIK